MRFIDLFAGLGGFHLALRVLGHQCVFASEIDDTLRQLYERNFGMRPFGDIKDIDVANIPSHDILCAGFPCQPFSKAGDQDGLKDPKLGDLYLQILRVIHCHHPRYLILENVPNLAWHDNGSTWEQIKRLLEAEGYEVSMNRLSPHEFGVPQIRERMYIIAGLEGLHGFEWPDKQKGELSIHKVLDSYPPEARLLSESVKRCLDIWQEFLDCVPRDEKIPHPLWSMEFGATYPYKRTTPAMVSTDNLRYRYQGSHGRRLLEGKTREAVLGLLPSHARANQERFPRWKIQFIQRNRDFYERHKSWLDSWMQKIAEFPSSFQKLEWNCQERDPRKEVRLLNRYVIQIRPSGVRVKRTTTAPSLVAMTVTQVPIISWETRYMTPTECKRLQSMDGIDLPELDLKAYQALGNAVNVEVAQFVAERLVGRAPLLESLRDKIASAQPVAAIKRLIKRLIESPQPEVS